MTFKGKIDDTHYFRCIHGCHLTISDKGKRMFRSYSKMANVQLGAIA